MQRIVSIDVLRGFSLMIMILCHYMIAYGDALAAESIPYFILDHVIGDFGACWFLLIVGVSQALSSNRKEETSKLTLMKKAFIRGIYLFIAGLLMSALAFGPSEIWDWDILTLIGTATIVLYFCRFLPSYIILLICVALALTTPWLRSEVDFATAWGGELLPSTFISGYYPDILFEPAGIYKVNWNLKDIITGYFLSGTFPVFPWLAFPLLGLVIGRRIVSKKIKADLPFLVLIGIILIFLAGTVVYASTFRPVSSPISDYLAPLSFYPDSISMYYLQTGVTLVLFSLLYYYYDIREKSRQQTSLIVSWYQRMSRYSLTVYFYHWLLITWPLWIIYFLTGKFLAQDIMGSFPTLLLGFTVIALVLVLLKAWDHSGGKFSLEWGMKKLTGLMTSTKEIKSTK